MDDAFDQPTFFQPVKTVCDLVLIRDEQRITPLKRDADLRAGETTIPAEDDLSDRAGHAAPCEHEVGNGRNACILPFSHVMDAFTFSWPTI